jgi:hypothetical protein
MASETLSLTYEQRLNQDRKWAMDEGDRFFAGEDQVFKTLRRIGRRLDELDIPYAIAGGMALNAHGFRRLTIDVDILVTLDGLKKIHERLDGLGYLPPFANSKNLRDTESGVRIEFLIAGEFPGDGKPKPVAFPDPAEAAIERDGAKYLSLPKLIELKLASGMTGGIHRMKDFTDVVELIKILKLPIALREELNPYVVPKYEELWTALQEPLHGPDEDVAPLP